MSQSKGIIEEIKEAMRDIKPLDITHYHSLNDYTSHTFKVLPREVISHVHTVPSPYTHFDYFGDLDIEGVKKRLEEDNKKILAKIEKEV